MDYGKNKEAKGQNRASEETEMVVRANLSKDGKTLDLTATYLKEYGAKDVASFEFLKDLTTLEFGTNLIGPKGAKHIAQSKVLTNLTTLNLFYNNTSPSPTTCKACRTSSSPITTSATKAR